MFDDGTARWYVAVSAVMPSDATRSVQRRPDACGRQARACQTRFRASSRVETAPREGRSCEGSDRVGDGARAVGINRETAGRSELGEGRFYIEKSCSISARNLLPANFTTVEPCCPEQRHSGSGCVPFLFYEISIASSQITII